MSCDLLGGVILTMVAISKRQWAWRCKLSDAARMSSQYCETCVNDHLHGATTCLKTEVPTERALKATVTGPVYSDHLSTADYYGLLSACYVTYVRRPENSECGL